MEVRCRRCLYLLQELGRHVVDVEMRYGGMENRCRRADVGGMEV